MFRIGLHSFRENGDIEWKGVTTMKLQKAAGAFLPINAGFGKWLLRLPLTENPTS
jgi:hypothetical protein